MTDPTKPGEGMPERPERVVVYFQHGWPSFPDDEAHPITPDIAPLCVRYVRADLYAQAVAERDAERKRAERLLQGCDLLANAEVVLARLVDAASAGLLIGREATLIADAEAVIRRVEEWDKRTPLRDLIPAKALASDRAGEEGGG